MAKQQEKESKFSLLFFIRKRMSRKVATALFALILIVFTITGILISNYTKSLLIENAETNLITKSDAIAEQVDSLFRDKATIVRQMGTNQELMKFLKSADSRDEVLENEFYPGVSQALDEIAKTDSSIAMTWVASNRSNFLIGSNKVLSDPSFNLEERPWYEHALSEEDVYFTEPYMDEVFGKIILSAMAPIKENNDVIGIVAIDIFLDELPEMMRSFTLGETGYPFLITRDGTTIYHPNEEYILEEQIQNLDGDIGEIGNKMVAGENGLELANVNNQREYIGYSPVATTDWAIGTSLPEAEVLAGLKSFTVTMSILLSIGCWLLIIAVILLLRYMLKDIPQISKVMNELGNGNLNVVNIETKSMDEIGQLVNSMNQMQDNMRHVIGKITTVSHSVSSKSEELTQSANEVKDGSEQVATTMQDLAFGSESQANTTTDLSSLMTNFTEKAKKANENSNIVYDSSLVVLNYTKEGSNHVERSTKQMEKIDQVIYDSVRKVENLESHTQKINQLVAVIKDIANQTNLLALNASIEAARAGESGKGFAVVANEVGKLAKQVASSVSGITETVETIQLETSQVTATLNAGYQEVEQGTEEIKVTRETFEQINNSVKTTVKEIKTVTNNLAAISKDSEKINSSIQEIAAISEDSAAGIEETSASSEEITSSMEEVAASSVELAELAEELNELIKQFKL